MIFFAITSNTWMSQDKTFQLMSVPNGLVMVDEDVNREGRFTARTAPIPMDVATYHCRHKKQARQ